MTSQRKVASQETLGCGQHSTLRISAGRTASRGVGLNNSSPPASRYHRRSVPSTLPARPVQADLWQSQRGLCSGSCNHGNLQPALLCPEGGLPVCGCHAGRVFWVSRWGCCFLLTQEALAVAFLEGRVQGAPKHVHWGSVTCQHRVGASLTLLSILTTSLEVGVPTAILQIGQLRFGKVTCPKSPNQEVADPGLNKSAPDHDI